MIEQSIDTTTPHHPRRGALQRTYPCKGKWSREQQLLESIKAVESRSSDATTSAHLADLRNQIETILEGPNL